MRLSLLIAATLLPSWLSGQNRAATIASGGDHSCAISNATLFCWGANTSGELGDGSTAPRRRPVRVAGIRAPAGVWAADNGTCALDGDGAAFCWGNGSGGRLGNREHSSSGSGLPVPVDDVPRFTTLATGSSHTCGLAADERLTCWGEAGAFIWLTSPTLLSATLRARAIAVGSSVGCAVATDSAAWCWGSDIFGQLASDSMPAVPKRRGGDDSDGPVPIRGTMHYLHLAVGRGHICGLVTDGSIACWGANTFGESGQAAPAITDVSAVMAARHKVPGRVATDSALTFVSVVAGAAHTCGVTAASEVYCWGSNKSGQLGNGEARDSREPVKVRFP